MESGRQENIGAENTEQGNTGAEDIPLGAPLRDDTRLNDEERTAAGSAIPGSAAPSGSEGGFEPAPGVSPAEAAAAAAAEARAPEQPIAPGYQPYAAVPPPPAPAYQPYQPRPPYGP